MPFEKGHKLGKGRPTKIDEQKANTIFLNALKDLYNTEIDDDAKETFVKKVLMESPRGQLFIAEHLFGKPKETVEQTLNINEFNIKDIVKFKD
jgi:hypothetical protein